MVGISIGLLHIKCIGDCGKEIWTVVTPHCWRSVLWHPGNCLAEKQLLGRCFDAWLAGCNLFSAPWGWLWWKGKAMRG